MPLLGKSQLRAVSSIALISVAALAGCGVATSEPTQGSSTSASATGESTSISFSKASSSATSASSASATASATPTKDLPAVNVPAGYKTVTAPANNLSFAVPEDWISIDSASLSDEAAVQEFLGQLSEESSLTQEKLVSSLGPRDLLAMATSRKGTGFIENLLVTKRPEAYSAVPTEAVVAAKLEKDGATPGAYQIVETPLGEAARQTYTIEVSGNTLYGIYLMVPSGKAEGTYTSILVTTIVEERTNELADALLGSLSKAK